MLRSLTPQHRRRRGVDVLSEVWNDSRFRIDRSPIWRGHHRQAVGKLQALCRRPDNSNVSHVDRARQREERKTGVASTSQASELSPAMTGLPLFLLLGHAVEVKIGIRSFIAGAYLDPAPPHGKANATSQGQHNP